MSSSASVPSTELLLFAVLKNPETSRSIDHVIEQIFGYLDWSSLVSCELVCKSWRQALSTNKIWSNVLQRKVAKDPKWRQWYNHLAIRIDESAVKEDCLYFRKLCDRIHRCQQISVENWTTGNLARRYLPTEQTEDVRCMAMDDSLLAIGHADGSISVWNRRTLRLEKKLMAARATPRYMALQIQRQVVVMQTGTDICVWNIDGDDQPVTVMATDWVYPVSLRFKHGLIISVTIGQQAIRSLTARRLTGELGVLTEFCLQQSGPVLPRNELRIEFWDFDEQRIFLVWRPILLRDGQIESQCELHIRLLSDIHQLHLSTKVAERHGNQRQHYAYCDGCIIRKENGCDIEIWSADDLSLKWILSDDLSLDFLRCNCELLVAKERGGPVRVWRWKRLSAFRTRSQDVQLWCRKDLFLYEESLVDDLQIVTRRDSSVCLWDFSSLEQRATHSNSPGLSFAE